VKSVITLAFYLIIKTVNRFDSMPWTRAQRRASTCVKWRYPDAVNYSMGRK